MAMPTTPLVRDDSSPRLLVSAWQPEKKTSFATQYLQGWFHPIDSHQNNATSQQQPKQQESTGNTTVFLKDLNKMHQRYIIL